MQHKLPVQIENFVASFEKKMSSSDILNAFKDPIFIVSAPRSGSTLLFKTLSRSPDIWTIGGESHPIFAHFPHLKMENSNYDSGALGKKHADKKTASAIRALYAASVINRNNEKFIDSAKKIKNLYFLEKTPRNSLNIPFIKAIYPSAKFIFLYRDPRENISSIIEAWEHGEKTGQFITFKDLPDWPMGYWCLLLPKNWRSMKGKSIAEIASFQWQSCNDVILDELDHLPQDKWISVGYSDIISNTESAINKLSDFIGSGIDDQFQQYITTELPHSPTVVSTPKSGKWKKNEHLILPLLPALQRTEDRIKALLQ